MSIRTNNVYIDSYTPKNSEKNLDTIFLFIYNSNRFYNYIFSTFYNNLCIINYTPFHYLQSDILLYKTKMYCTMVIYNICIHIYACVHIIYTYIDTFDDIYILFLVFHIDFNMYMTVNTKY